MPKLTYDLEDGDVLLLKRKVDGRVVSMRIDVNDFVDNIYDQITDKLGRDYNMIYNPY